MGMFKNIFLFEVVLYKSHFINIFTFSLSLTIDYFLNLPLKTILQSFFESHAIKS